MMMDGKELQEVIVKYKKKIEKRVKENKIDGLLQDCASGTDIKRVIEMATTARGNNGKRHSHQLRRSNETLKEFSIRILILAPDLENAESFDEIYRLIQGCAIKDIADLTIYDTAHRIGAFLNLYPDKVFLHTGTRIGAKKLLGRIAGPYLSMNHLPVELQRSGLSPAEIEDFLCHCKDQLSYYQ